MRSVEFLQVVACGAKVHQVLARLVEFEDVVACITVCQNDVAIRRNCDRCRAPHGQLQSGCFWDAYLQHDLSGHGVKLDPFAGSITSTVEKLIVAFGANFEIVDICVLLAEETPNDFSVWRKDKNPQARTGVDAACLVDGNSTVRRSQNTLAVRAEPPTGDRVKGHRSTPHSHR